MNSHKIGATQARTLVPLVLFSTAKVYVDTFVGQVFVTSPRPHCIETNVILLYFFPLSFYNNIFFCYHAFSSVTFFQAQTAVPDWIRPYNKI